MIRNGCDEAFAERLDRLLGRREPRRKPAVCGHVLRLRRRQSRAVMTALWSKAQTS